MPHVAQDMATWQHGFHIGQTAGFSLRFRGEFLVVCGCKMGPMAEEPQSSHALSAR
jgi:hypothetical protein